MTETVLYPRKRPAMYTAERDAIIRDNPTVDPFLLAITMGLHVRTVYLYQRRLGVRLCTSHGKRRERV
jgi:hypothetical protein